MRLALVIGLALAPQLAEARRRPPVMHAVAPGWQRLTAIPTDVPTPRDAGTVDMADGTKIWWGRYGTGDAPSDRPPVVLLHGGMGNSDHWAHQIKALASTHDVIAIDSRGHGRSTRPTDTKATPSYDVMADDVLAVLDHLHVAKASFVGWSDGGEIALKLGVHHGDRVAKLFILGANYDAKGAKSRKKPSKTFNAYGAKCRADYAKLSPTPKDYDATVKWLLPIWRNPMGFSKDQLRSIQAPTIVADGDHDEIIVLDQIKEMATLIPHAELRVFEDSSHFVLWQHPDALSQALVDFLE